MKTHKVIRSLLYPVVVLLAAFHGFGFWKPWKLYGELWSIGFGKAVQGYGKGEDSTEESWKATFTGEEEH